MGQRLNEVFEFDNGNSKGFVRVTNDTIYVIGNIGATSYIKFYEWFNTLVDKLDKDNLIINVSELVYANSTICMWIQKRVFMSVAKNITLIFHRDYMSLDIQQSIFDSIHDIRENTKILFQ